MKGVRVFEVSECVICRAEDVAPTTILKPCGHRAVCDACIKILLEQNNLCPVCRKKITNLPSKKYSGILVVFVALLIFVCVYVGCALYAFEVYIDWANGFHHQNNTRFV